MKDVGPRVGVGPKIIVALDFAQRQSALSLVECLDPALCRLKVGKEMFTLFGPGFVHELHSRGFEVFLDLKFHDIPNTAAMAVRAAADLGVWMVNVHAFGGRRMMEACAEVLAPLGAERPRLIAVTVLTSMLREDLRDLGLDVEPEEQVLRLARLARESGMDGVVCSGQEAAMLKSIMGREFSLVTPGIRPLFAAAGDQKRTMTPSEALIAGVDYLVIGRPITRAVDPMLALRAILGEMAVIQS